ncbi:MAG TPA: hypothetical protein VNR64_08870, partial [Vicinamibacterales bacterium]|nr:hypothetical protein [Vicinamibacterales bacterium]
AFTQARDSLAQLASMPEAAKLQGDARTQVSQLISNFNELITTQSNWKDAYGKVENNLNALIGPDTGAAAGSMAGTAGTSGTGTAAPTGTAGSAAANPSGSAAASGEAAGAAQLDPAIRAKLVEFRTHLKAFEQAAGGEAAISSSAPSTEPSNPSSATPPANPSNPASPSTPPMSAPPASTTTATQGAVGTSGTSAPAATDARTAEMQTQANRELDAIQAILAQSKNGRLDKAQVDELKSHLSQLRQLLGGGSSK